MSNFQIFKFSKIQIFKFSNFQKFKFLNFQIFKFSKIQIFKFPKIWKSAKKFMETRPVDLTGSWTPLQQPFRRGKHIFLSSKLPGGWWKPNRPAELGNRLKIATYPRHRFHWMLVELVSNWSCWVKQRVSNVKYFHDYVPWFYLCLLNEK